MNKNDFDTSMIREIEISKLKPFDNYPFSIDTDYDMDNLISSIQDYGVLEKLIVRPINDSKFSHEIISGLRRAKASETIGMSTIVCEIRDLDDSESTILMVDSNLTQRKTIKFSEKAKAYKMRMDAIKSQGKRNDLTSVQVARKSENTLSRDVIANENNVSGDTIRRYIRLNELIPPLLQKLDDRKIAFTPCVELSYLSSHQQQNLLSVLESEDKYDVPLKVASKLKNIAQYGNLTNEKIQTIVTKDFNKPPKNYKISYSSVTKYFDKDVTPSEVNETIDKALALWMKMRQSMKSKPKDHER